MKKTIGERVRRLRLALGMNQNRFSQMLDTSHVTIYRWEIGESTPDGPTRSLITLILDRIDAIGFKDFGRRLDGSNRIEDFMAALWSTPVRRRNGNG